MKTSTLMHAMETYKNGTFFNIRFVSKPEPVAKYKGIQLSKEIYAQVRSGIAYSHMVKIIEERNKSNKQITSRTPWWSWVPGFERIFKKHNKTEQIYITVIPHKIYEVKYFVDNDEVSKEEYEKYLTPSSINSRSLIFDIKVENVISVR